MKSSSPYRAIVSACVISLGTFGASPARAQGSSSAAAQGLFDQAKALMAAGKAVEACPKLEESQRLDPGSGTLINLAHCYEETGRIASAWSTYLEAAAAASAVGNTDRETGARERAAALAPKVSNLVVDVPPESRVGGLRITRDGVDVGAAQWGLPIPSDEGAHEIIAAAPGRTEWRSTIAVEGHGTTSTVRVPKLAEIASALVPTGTPAAPVLTTASSNDSATEEPRSSPLGAQRVGALALAGVGVAGLAVGTIFGLQAKSKKDEADETCDGGVCTTDSGVRAGEDAHKAGNIATIGMVVGTAAVVGGVVLWFTAPSANQAYGTRIGLGPNGVALRSVF
jgi:hypothetical protein